MQDVFHSLSVEEHEQLHAAISYPEDTISALMDFDMITMHDNITIEIISRYLRRLDKMPDHTDQLFIINREQHLRNLLPINHLLMTDLNIPISKIMTIESVKLHPDEKAQNTTLAFERYDLVSTPMIDDNNKLINHVTINAVIDFIREETDSEILNTSDLHKKKDLFTSI